MQTMSILGRVLPSFLLLLACQGAVVPPRAHTLRTNMLKESIRLLDQLQQTQVPCNQMKVPNIFADNKAGNTTEILCKAATVALEGRSCHRYLEGISDNLLRLVLPERTEQEMPCPVAAASTTSLKDFLKELHRVLQEEYKNQK